MIHRRSALLATMVAGSLLAATVSQAASATRVAVDRTQVSTELGRTFSFTATVRAEGAPSGPLVAHLNVLSLRPGTYVDPEDWSSDRTRYLGSLPSGGERTLTWRVKAVNSGSFAVYVSVLPQGGAGTPANSPAIRAAVADRQTLDPGGILPLAIAVPVGIGVATGLTWRLRRRR